MATFYVRSSAELENALSAANGGDVITLASGDYGALNLRNATFSSEVKIISENPNDMASFSSMNLVGASNLTFESVKFDYTYKTGQSVMSRPFRVTDSSDIKFDSAVFEGDFVSGTGTTADGAGAGRALMLSSSQNIDIVNSEFFAWWKAISMGGSENVNLIGNDIHTIRSDGIVIGRSTNVLVENNYIHDFGGAAGSGDHRDMIQIMRAQGEGAHNVTIRDNIFDVGEGDYTQTIFAGSDKANASDPTHWHTNLVIEGNLIYNNHTHGISVAMTDGLTITDNTLVAIPRDKTGGVTIPKIHVSSDSRDVTIEGNAAAGVSGNNASSDWNVANNLIIQNTSPNQSGYYDDVFVFHATSAEDGYNQYGVKPGGLLDTMNVGSSLSDMFPISYDAWVNGTSTVPTDTTGGTNNQTPPTEPDTGGETGSETGGETGTGGDTTDTGPNTGSGGTVIDGLMEFDDYILDFADLSGGSLIGDAAVIDTPTGQAIKMDGDGDVVKLGRLSEFEESEQLAFTISYARDEADGSTQRLVWNGGHVGLTISGDGLAAHIGNTEGKFTSGFRVDNLGLNDTDTHQITVLVDENTDHLQIIVDGELVHEETDVDFDFSENRETGWQLGFKHNRTIDGEIYDFAVDDDVQFVESPVFDDYQTLA
ncbi:right-handed parallel beta-helix repeat-containing protein (plasmid) [Aliiroseovarius sp. M344]|uniref:right-handed parallel beta-helix repeat-containing protein n=1 Tax=Aliiroseovarius sp. M344 TaxID=2867010 RepID=UPI0021AE1838|nr:right-handed parallel beta-helix repeat-containing protein [Aliiroseovarius sp. M344]UWQ16053.1 right-handed parallel beta-helix repeat-containing protein [Aliiroseovarius sp. M344]